VFPIVESGKAGVSSNQGTTENTEVISGRKFEKAVLTAKSPKAPRKCRGLM